MAEKDAEKQSKDADRVALIIQDFYTRYLDAFPAKTKDHEEVLEAFRQFLGFKHELKAVYSDNAGEIIKAVKKLGGCEATCTPHIPQTNGIAENSVRRVKEGTACMLYQSGLSHRSVSATLGTFPI